MTIINYTLFLLDPEIHKPPSNFHNTQALPPPVGQGIKLYAFSRLLFTVLIQKYFMNKTAH